MYRSILVPLDGSPFSEQALPIARALAELAGASLALVRVRPTEPIPPALLAPDISSTIEAEDTAEAERYLQRIRGSLPSGVRTDSSVPRGPVAESIVARAHSLGADLIVMTTHGRTGLSRLWLGSVADAVVRTASVPVLLWHPREIAAAIDVDEIFAHMVVPLDGSAEAEGVLPHVRELCRLWRSRLTLVRAVEPVVVPAVVGVDIAPIWQVDRGLTDAAMAAARDYLNGIASSLMEGGGAPTNIDIRIPLAESPGRAILLEVDAHHGALVAMTTHARRGSRLILGSVADKVLRGSNGAVLLVHYGAHATTATIA